MVFAAMLLAQAAPPAPPADDEIVVTGERPRDFRIVMKRDRTGVKRCMLKPPSGDPLFDGSVCNAYLACVPMVRTAREMEACMTPPLGQAVKGWLERRKAAMVTR